jgi:diguanylate cyclase (GGDEF)-like protein
MGGRLAQGLDSTQSNSGQRGSALILGFAPCTSNALPALCDYESHVIGRIFPLMNTNGAVHHSEYHADWSFSRTCRSLRIEGCKSAQSMPMAVNFDPTREADEDDRGFARSRQTWILGIIFAALIAAQALGFLVLGTARLGLGLSESIIVLQGLIAIFCAWIALRRAQGVAALFWFLFIAVLLVLLVPTALQAYDTAYGQTILSESTRGLLYALYGAPVLMMLFLPETYRRGHVKSEIFLDLFQVAIVVGLIYSTFFFIPSRRMLPADALLRNVSITDAQSLLLLIAALVRLQFARLPATRNLLLRLALFLLICTVATFTGDWIYLRYSSGGAWFDLGWAIPQAVAGFIALTWKSSTSGPESVAEPASFLTFLGTNLVLVAMLSCIALLMDRWKAAYGEILASVAIAVSLLALTLRLALTQFHQQQEIAQRKTAQKQLTASHQTIGRLLDSARSQTAEITQISELGSLLQVCASREEVFRLIPERLRRLFPGASGSIALLSESRNRVESVAEWGICPVDQIFSPDLCWALRRGRIHAHAGGLSEPRCAHLPGEGDSVCIPLIAVGQTFGTLAIQNDELMPPVVLSPLVFSPLVDFDGESDAFSRRRQLATTVAEQIALAIANLNLRESLRLQAVRDPLTGLYNRRYMQEFLERELHSARRKHRPVAVMMLDLDHFKRYNDNYGHPAGDEALAAVGEALQRSVRAEDVACRYGGEEFALILPECSLRQAAARGEEIRKRIREYKSRRNRDVTDTLTVSIGVAAFDETTDRVDLLLKFADDALYEAKRGGRDRVVMARPAAALPEFNLTKATPASVVAIETT